MKCPICRLELASREQMSHHDGYRVACDHCGQFSVLGLQVEILPKLTRNNSALVDRLRNWIRSRGEEFPLIDSRAVSEALEQAV